LPKPFLRFLTSFCSDTGTFDIWSESGRCKHYWSSILVFASKNPERLSPAAWGHVQPCHEQLLPGNPLLTIVPKLFGTFMRPVYITGAISPLVWLKSAKRTIRYWPMLDELPSPILSINWLESLSQY
jgi:hypothetical protein